MQRQLAPSLIDSHVHTDDDRLQPDQATIMQSARAANIIAQIVPGISQPLWPRVKALCDAHSDLYPCYGLHPCFPEEHKPLHIDELKRWLEREHPVAVGECGLDYQIVDADKVQQQQLFEAQLSLAREFDLPVVIHARKAVEQVINMIRASGHFCGMIHSYNGSAQQAGKLIDLGYKLSFGGAVTYDRASRLRKLVAQLPLDCLLLETDAPDQTDARHQGLLNQPAFLVDIWQAISALRQEDPETLAAATTDNAIALFRLPLTAGNRQKPGQK
ncbi:TatD family hydrolase [Granulosicoccus antarcticus]|uniref:Putative metal-dependent hydrolase YjjV n=1 Tax=Granulosicoccus antarcticus IMCC3135 TaxID=1192854 RepID=A0A2Z2NKP8_9GAMM|nr:TatD family hydrolase [Granulosicoccus antarcticus]ASJ71095.1 putative metal-dependent hydrolase YjjV [Granulosicoccus antarcticus IMCC3135]